MVKKNCFYGQMVGRWHENSTEMYGRYVQGGIEPGVVSGNQRNTREKQI